MPVPHPAAALPIRIVIADDHPLIREGLRAALRRHKEVKIVGEAANGKELVDAVNILQPDVVLTDINMPVMDGIEATRHITRAFPQVGVIALTNINEPAIITDMHEAGATGYLLKNAGKEEILEAVHKVREGQYYYTADVAGQLLALMKRRDFNPAKHEAPPQLSSKETEVLKLVCEGYSAKEIAAKLRVDVRSVNSAKERILQKTGCRNLASMAVFAIRHFIYKLR